MTEDELRALVRTAIERHLGKPGSQTTETRSAPTPRDYSHLLLRVSPGSDVDEGLCLIEPAVRCNHCGYCQSLGH